MPLKSRATVQMLKVNEIIVLVKKKKCKTTFRPNVMHCIDIINVDIN